MCFCERGGGALACALACEHIRACSNASVCGGWRMFECLCACVYFGVVYCRQGACRGAVPHPNRAGVRSSPSLWCSGLGLPASYSFQTCSCVHWYTTCLPVYFRKTQRCNGWGGGLYPYTVGVEDCTPVLLGWRTVPLFGWGGGLYPCTVGVEDCTPARLGWRTVPLHGWGGGLYPETEAEGPEGTQGLSVLSRVEGVGSL